MVKRNKKNPLKDSITPEIYDRSGRVKNSDIAYGMALKEDEARSSVWSRIFPFIKDMKIREAHQSFEHKLEEGVAIKGKDLPRKVLENFYDDVNYQTGKLKVKGFKKIDYGDGRIAYRLVGEVTNQMMLHDADGSYEVSEKLPYNLRVDTEKGRIIDRRNTLASISLLAIVGLVGGSFLLVREGVTGGVIGANGVSSSSLIGGGLFILGLIATLIYTNIKRNRK